ncbi:MAG: type II secretion system F family protein [Gammaproteobacteria bacterium]
MAIELGATVAVRRTKPAAATKPLAPMARLPRRRGAGSGDRRGRRRFFTEQLALLLDTGMALVPALESLRAQTRDGALGDVLDGLATAINEGASFAAALEHYPELFDGAYVALVAAAEQGGYLQRALGHLLAVDEQNDELVGQLKSAFSYPLFLVVFSVAVVIFVLTVVFPRFGDLFSSIADQLPLTTRVLMWASDVLLAQSWWLGPLAVLGLVSAVRWAASPAGTARLHDWAGEVVGLRALMVRFYLVQTLRTLSLSLGNGVTLLDALGACRGVTPNRRFRAFIDDLRGSVQAGQGVASVCQRTDFLPELTRQMISTGEESGDLPLVTARLADHYQRELKRILISLSKVVEPAMLLVMGAVVGLIVSSLILPIFKLAHAVH